MKPKHDRTLELLNRIFARVRNITDAELAAFDRDLHDPESFTHEVRRGNA